MGVEKPDRIPITKSPLCGDEITIHVYGQTDEIECTEDLGHTTDHKVTNPDLLIQRYDPVKCWSRELETVTITWSHNHRND